MDILEISATETERLEQIVREVGWRRTEAGDIESAPGTIPIVVYPHHKVMVAIEDGKIRGLLFVAPHRNAHGITCYAEIKYLRSFPERQGTGRALVRKLQERGGMSEITLTALPGSYGFYEKMGFKPRGHSCYFKSPC